MKVILYIGHHKVGSTALQVFLSQNWLALAQNGILYPSVEPRGFAFNLASTLGRRDKAVPLPILIREQHSALAYRMMSEVSQRKIPPQFAHLPASGQMFLALRAQVNQIKPKALVLCSEVFSNFGEVQPDLIKRLCVAFPKAEFEVYCALRRPDDYLVSQHGQRLKVGEQLKPLSAGGTAPYFDTIHFNYRTVIQAWADQFPNARLILRPYHEIVAAGGSAEDFMEQCGVDFPADLAPVGRANPSLPRAAMEIVRRANQDLPAPQAQALRQYLLQTGPHLNPVKNSDVEMFGADLRAEMVRRFTPIHDWLSELTGSAFFPDIQDMAQPRPTPEHQATTGLLSRIDPGTLPDQDLRDYVAAFRQQTTC
ncbi:hypothetical protein I5535_18725 [Rhodobacteraceae bacterium F11138]|nr:hypothetical protein [Rhodobacteraceae bacterium F11138]